MLMCFASKVMLYVCKVQYLAFLLHVSSCIYATNILSSKCLLFICTRWDIYMAMVHLFQHIYWDNTDWWYLFVTLLPLPSATAGPCSPNPCLNGGVCFRNDNNGESTFICNCPSGFTGDTCEEGMLVSWNHPKASVSSLATIMSANNVYVRATAVYMFVGCMTQSSMCAHNMSWRKQSCIALHLLIYNGELKKYYQTQSYLISNFHCLSCWSMFT